MNKDYSLRKTFHSLTGEKTFLSLFTQSDINELYISWLNEPIVTQFSNQRFRPHTYETCLAYFNSFKESDNLLIKVQRRIDRAFIGTMTTYYISQHRTADIGIMIGEKTVWGQGYGQDAWNTQLSWLSTLSFIRKITAGTMRPNVGMLRLMERSGMALEAVRFQQELLDDTPQDILYYSYFPHDTGF